MTTIVARLQNHWFTWLAIGFLIAAVVILSGCQQGPNIADDGYYFEGKQENILNPAISVVTYRNRDELVKAYQTIAKGRNLGSKEELAAFSVVNPKTGKCVIHTVDPAISYEPEFLGHELTHCLYGNWHPVQDSIRSAS